MVAPLIVGAARAVGGEAVKKTSARSVSGSKMGTRARKTLQQNPKNNYIQADSRQRMTNNATYARKIQEKTNAGIKRIFSQNGEVVTDDELELLTKEPPLIPSFPFVIVGMAVLKDILDIPLELTLIGIVLTTVFSFLIAIALFFWCFGKVGGGWWKKKLIRWLWKRYIIAIILEFIPFIKMIPVTTIFVLMGHYKETKIVKLANLALDEIRRAGGLALTK